MNKNVTLFKRRLAHFFLLHRSRYRIRDIFYFLLRVYLFVTVTALIAVFFVEQLTPGGYLKDGFNLEYFAITISLCLIISTIVAFPYVIINMRIVRDAKDKQKQLEKINREMEITNEHRARFVAYVSHELRNPLNGMMGILDTMNLDKFEAEEREQIARLRRHSDDLYYIVSDILELSKVDSGVFDLKAEPTQVINLVEEQVRFWSARARSKGLSLEFTHERDFPDWLLVDPYRLRQIINNLISNAIKYTECGFIHLMLQKNDKNQMVEIMIKDSGLGIPKELVGEIFNPYIQVAEHQRGSVNLGTGLGLSIARQLARRMGGDVQIAETSPKGTTFVITFLMRTVDVLDQNRDKREKVLASFHSKRAFVLDDAVSNCFVAKTFMEKLGMEVQFDTESDRALETLQSQKFDVILLDDQLSTTDSVTVYRKTRQFQLDAKFIAYTGNVNIETERRLAGVGFNGFLGKPVTLSSITNELIRVFQN